MAKSTLFLSSFRMVVAMVSFRVATGLIALAVLLSSPVAPMAQENQIKGVQTVDRNVVFRNRSGQTIVSFVSSNSQAERWGKNLLASSTIPNGRSFKLNFDNPRGYCLFDFRAVLADGRWIEVAELDVCAIGTFDFIP